MQESKGAAETPPPVKPEETAALQRGAGPTPTVPPPIPPEQAGPGFWETMGKGYSELGRAAFGGPRTSGGYTSKRMVRRLGQAWERPEVRKAVGYTAAGAVGAPIALGVAGKARQAVLGEPKYQVVGGQLVKVGEKLAQRVGPTNSLASTLSLAPSIGINAGRPSSLTGAGAARGIMSVIGGATAPRTI